MAPKRLCRLAGIGEDWQPRETRHTFVSALSDADVDIEKIADAVGHINSNVARAVHRHQISDVVSETATVMALPGRRRRVSAVQGLIGSRFRLPHGLISS